jgi:MFS family permease
VLVAFPLLATTVTRDPVLISGVAFASTLPWLVVALPAGALADRLSRRFLVIGVETARAAVVLALAAAIATHHLKIVELYLAAFLITAMETVFDSATMAVVPQLLGPEALVLGNSRMFVAQTTGEQFIGPALGGIAFAAAKSVPAFGDGLSFLASAALLALALRPASRLGKHGHRGSEFGLVEPSSAGLRPSLSRDISTGLRWLWNEQRLRILTPLVSVFAFCQGMTLAVIVIYCTRVLHLSGTGFGLFVATTATGNVVGGWAAPRVNDRLGTGMTLLAAGVLGGAGLAAVGLTSATGIAIVALIAEAVAVGIGNVASVALRQQIIPLDLAGRVSATMRSCIFGSAAIGALVGGALVVAAGAHAPFAFGGVVQIAAALLLGGALIARLAAHESQVVDVRDSVDLREQAVEVP